MVATCRDVKVKHIHAILQCEKVGRLPPTTSRSSQFLELPLHPPETRCFHFHFDPLCPWTGFVTFSLTWQACIFGVTSLRAVKCRRHCGLLWYHRFSWQALPAKSGVRVSGVALIPFKFWISFPVVSLDLLSPWISRQPCHAAWAWHAVMHAMFVSHELWTSGLDVSSGEPFEVRKSPRHDQSVTELALVKTTKVDSRHRKNSTLRCSHSRKNTIWKLFCTPSIGRWSFPSFFDRSSVVRFFLVSFCSFCCPFKECLDRSRGNITSDRSALRCLAMGLALRRHEVRDK